MTEASRQQRDAAARAWHERATANGEERLLARTVGGELHSYAPDEVGFARTGLGPKLGSALGMAVLAAVFAALTVLSIVMLVSPIADGESPFWGALVLTVGAVAGLVYAARLALKERAATKLRRERGVPEPGKSNV